MIVGCFSLWICVNRRVCEIHGFCSPVLIGQALACLVGTGGDARDHHSLVSSQLVSASSLTGGFVRDRLHAGCSGALSLRVTEFAGENVPDLTIWHGD